jgi:hypothetical protein
LAKLFQLVKCMWSSSSPCESWFGCLREEKSLWPLPDLNPEFSCLWPGCSTACKNDGSRMFIKTQSYTTYTLFITVSAHVYMYVYVTFDIFYISRSLVVPSVDHLNMNKLLTNTKSHERFCQVISFKISKNSKIYCH